MEDPDAPREPRPDPASGPAGGAAPRPPRHDPAAPHTAPFPAHIPRWLAWVVLAAFAVSGAVCTGLLVGG